MTAGLQGKIPSNLVLPALFASPPDLLMWFTSALHFPASASFPVPQDLAIHFRFPAHLLTLSSTQKLCAQTRRWCELYQTLFTSKPPGEVVTDMCKRKITEKDLDTLPVSLALLFRQVLRTCRDDPPDNLSSAALSLIGREDLLAFSESPPKHGMTASRPNVSLLYYFFFLL